FSFATPHYSLCYSLYFFRSVYHRHLHSFPTRRSSDLFLSNRSRPLGTSAGHGWELIFPIQEPEYSVPCRNAPGRCQRLYFHEQQDRKSTRLNSSHVEISYAVFCLKKKIKT